LNGRYGRAEATPCDFGRAVTLLPFRLHIRSSATAAHPCARSNAGQIRDYSRGADLVTPAIRMIRRTSVLFVPAALLTSVSAFAQTSVVTQHNDAARTGANLTETILTTTNVNVSEFGKLFERTVDDEIYGQPLYVDGVNIPGVGVRNIVFVTTNNDSVYAFDADDPAASAPLWRVTYTNPAAGILPVSRTDVGQACGTYVDFAGNIGIGGTPAIDLPSQTMYFVTRTKESGAFVQRLHAVDIRDGSEKAGSPVLIQANVTGTGDGRDAQNNIAFNARTQNQRSALLIDHGTLYIAWASYCDQGPYHGWILGYDAASLQQVMVHNTSPDGGLSGIWQSGGGLAADAAGNLYALTGNGSFNGDTGGRNYGNSFIKVSPAGVLLDWFTPFNWSFLNSTDEDLGIQNPLLIPGTNLIVGGGKEGVMYVVDRTNMGHFRSGNNGQIVQSFQASSAARMNGAPVYWNGSTYGPAIYVWPAGDPLKVFRLVGNVFTTPASAQSTVLAPGGMPGGMLSLSANGTASGSGILWATLSRAGDANHAPQPGILRAYDAGNVTRELWNSQQNATRDTLGNFSKFSPPTIANGKVYVATLSNTLVVYGLIGGSGGNTTPVVNAGSDQVLLSPGTATLTGTATDDGNPAPPQLTTTWSLVNGPAAVTFSAATALTTTATFPAPGTYTIRLSAFDGQAASSDDLTVVVGAPAGSGTGLLAQYFNDAGSGVYFTALALTRTDPAVDFDWASAAPDPAVQTDNFSVRWSGQIQAPVTGTFTFTTTSDDGVRLYVNGQLLIDNWTDHGVVQNSGTIALVADQKYDIRMDYYDHGQLATARLSWSYPGQTLQVVPQWVLYPAPPANQPPTVDAGADKTITLPSTAALNGIARDDGLPGPALTTTWSKISGREDSAGGTVTFSNPNAPVTTATFGADGIYVLRLTVSDGAVTVSDDVTVVVNPVPPNTAPVVNAGADQTITLPSSATLSGSATDDGLPSPPAQLTRTWTKVSGPGTVTFANPSAASTTATFSAAGTYVLRLTASDSVLSSFDELTVTVNAAPANGLTAKYYKDPGNGTHFATLVLTRVDPTVNFSWGTAAPATGVTADNFSVRWTGRVQAPVTGSYRFTTVSDDGIRLWVNGVQVINNWTDHAAATNTSAGISLTAGVKYTITLEYYERTGQATAKLQWTPPGQALQVIPQSRLFQ
jgi:PA14 domain/K319L-like, PKD domain